MTDEEIAQIVNVANELYHKDYPVYKYAVNEGYVEYILKAMRKLGYCVIVKDDLAEAEWYQQFEEKV
jgi:hypothetical protein